MLPLSAKHLAAIETAESEGETADILRRHGLRALAEVGNAEERQRPQGLDREQVGAALGTLAERARPRFGHALALLLPLDQLARPLDVAPDRRA